MSATSSASNDARAVEQVTDEDAADEADNADDADRSEVGSAEDEDEDEDGDNDDEEAAAVDDDDGNSAIAEDGWAADGVEGDDAPSMSRLRTSET
jgi:hypothetical protein